MAVEYGWNGTSWVPLTSAPPSSSDAWGEQLVTWDGTQWHYQGTAIADRPDADYVAGSRVVWDTSQDVTFTTAPTLMVPGDLWVPHASLSGGSSGTDGHIVQNEGTNLAARAALNFVGAGVNATDDSVNDRTIVTISGSTDGHTIQEEGTALTARAGLNFIGPAVVAADDSANSRTNVTISTPNMIVLGPSDPIPGGTPAGTVIIRTT